MQYISNKNSYVKTCYICLTMYNLSYLYIHRCMLCFYVKVQNTLITVNILLRATELIFINIIHYTLILSIHILSAEANKATAISRISKSAISFYFNISPPKYNIFNHLPFDPYTILLYNCSVGAMTQKRRS